MKEQIVREMPTILTVSAVVGLVGTTVLAIKATPRVMDLIYSEEISVGRDLEFKEKVALVWKEYIPTALVGFATIGAIVTSNQIHLQRTAAMSAVYGMTLDTLKTYQSKVIENIGEKKEQKMRDDIVQDRLNKNPVENHPPLEYQEGEVLFYDDLSGRYFKSTMEKVRSAVNDFNQQLINNVMEKDLNDFYYSIGLEGTELGRLLGWKIDNGLLVVEYTTKLATNNVPCIVIQYQAHPTFL